MKACIFEKGTLFFNLGKGTPQGGVVSLLVANLVLDSCQKAIWDAVYEFFKNKKCAEKTLFIRYADDFVILSPKKEHLNIVIEAFKMFISKLGLNINFTKSRILHTLNEENCKDHNTKFDF